MILGVDIGNTTISFGLVKEEKVRRVWKIWTTLRRSQLSRQLKKVLRQILRASRNLEAILVCSVVPRLIPTVKSELRRKFKQKIFVIGRDMIVPMKNRYRHPRQVGQDRLVGAYGAKMLYGTPCIIVDLGTAITFDVVSKKGEYMGGLIVPGIRLSVESLFKKTALLPKVRIEQPKELIGRDTKNSILSGIFHGYGTLVDGIIEKASRGLGRKPIVIATGGHT